MKKILSIRTFQRDSHTRMVENESTYFLIAYVYSIEIPRFIIRRKAFDLLFNIFFITTTRFLSYLVYDFLKSSDFDVVKFESVNLIGLAPDVEYY